MGLISTLGDWLAGFAPLSAKKSVILDNGDELIHHTPMIYQLGRQDYITQDFDIERLPDDMLILTEELDYDTVFICGGYAAFVAGFTVEYGDIDFFCTSKQTFDILSGRLNNKKDKSPTVVAGDYEGYAINVVYCPDATSVEDILDSFDMTWCRIGIELQNPSLVIHPQADSESPIFDPDRLFAKNISRNNMVDRVFERYCKYKERRIKKCSLPDGVVHGTLFQHIKNTEPPQPSQIPQKVVDNSYWS